MKKINTIIISLIVLIGVFFLINSSFAGLITNGVSSFGNQVYGGEPRPPQQVAALIIKSIIGFLGIVFVSLFIYGGFMYMTAAGKEEKIKKAKDTLVSATIGLIIVLLSYAIASFIISAVLTGTGPGAGGSSGGTSGGSTSD